MKEEHEMNKKLFDKMDRMDKTMQESMGAFSGNVQSLNQTLVGGFAMLRDIMQQTGPSYLYTFPSMQSG